jgi:hypothetical protein
MSAHVVTFAYCTLTSPTTDPGRALLVTALVNDGSAFRYRLYFDTSLFVRTTALPIIKRTQHIPTQRTLSQ